MSRLPPQAKRVFKGEIFEVYQWPQELYDGTTATFEMLKRPDTVIIIPITQEGEILYLNQEQPGFPPFLSFPSGRLEEGEEPLEAARRELMEETGYEAADYALVQTIEPVAKIDWCVFVFIARGCRKVNEQDLDPGERIEVLRMSFENMLERVRKPNFRGTEIKAWLLEALPDPQKMKELRQLILS